MFEKLDQIKKSYHETTAQLSDPVVISDQKLYAQLGRQANEIREIVESYERYLAITAQIADNEALLADDDPEMKELAQAEIETLAAERSALEESIKLMLIPKDPFDEKNVILEIRAGTGGDESALFAADLFRMYTRYAERKKWKVEILSASEIGLGGYKEIIASVSGKGVYGALKYESGTHRVQRVPETEAQGRIHTSAVTVAVLPEAEEVEISIDPKDIKVDVFRSSGPGGQSVNTTDSAVRITHIPTGIVVSCQDEKSQIKNKSKGMKILQARLLDAKRDEQDSERSEMRKTQVGSGDRSERIRTYNFPQGRMTDHRINLTLYRLATIIDGDLDEIVEALARHARQEALTAEEEGV